MFLALTNASVPVADAQKIANYYKGGYVGCWEPGESITDGGEPIFNAELITGFMMLCFFLIEVMDELDELFLQALLVFSDPVDRNGAGVDATEYRVHKPIFWVKSLMLDVFLGLRFYYVAAITIASGQLIMMEPGSLSFTLQFQNS
eukprot:COSAG05_NODE_1188_length_5580_cov_3.406495_3_plen_146_part_00